MTKLTREQSEEARYLAMWIVGKLTHKADNRTLEIPQAQLLARAYLASFDREGVVVPRAILEQARCPNCDGRGFTTYTVEAGVMEQEQCEWCYERHMALAAAQQPTRADVKE